MFKIIKYCILKHCLLKVILDMCTAIFYSSRRNVMKSGRNFIKSSRILDELAGKGGDRPCGLYYSNLFGISSGPTTTQSEISSESPTTQSEISSESPTTQSEISSESPTTQSEINSEPTTTQSEIRSTTRNIFLKHRFQTHMLFSGEMYRR